MAGKKKARCKNGHKLTEQNTYLRKDGTRECRECSRLRSKKQKQAVTV